MTLEADPLPLPWLDITRNGVVGTYELPTGATIPTEPCEIIEARKRLVGEVSVFAAVWRYRGGTWYGSVAVRQGSHILTSRWLGTWDYEQLRRDCEAWAGLLVSALGLARPRLCPISRAWR